MLSGVKRGPIFENKKGPSFEHKKGPRYEKELNAREVHNSVPSGDF